MDPKLPWIVGAIAWVGPAAHAQQVEIEVEAEPPPAPPPLDPAPAAPLAEPAPAEPWWRDPSTLEWSGYAQAQLVTNQASEDELTPDGAALNQDRFLIRRARLRVERDWRYANATLELDANTTRGPTLSVRRAEASLSWPGPSEAPPVAAVTAGLSGIPFGHELAERHSERLFAERTTGSLAFFRGEPDVGVTVWGGFGPVRYAVAAQNGVPLDDRAGGGSTVYTGQKTAVGRFGFEAGDAGWDAGGGASFLKGTGFHAGAPSTKSSLAWLDANQDGFVTLNELVAQPARAATPSATFPRWAVGADARLGVRTPLGFTRLSAEVTLASNLDRAYAPADPIATGYDLRELAWTAAAVQELGRWALVGFRADRYDPNADAFEARQGTFVPADLSVTTLSPALGVQFPGLARWVVQYDWVSDHLGRDTRALPIDLPNDQWTARVQVEF